MAVQLSTGETVFLALKGGYPEAMIRAASQADWYAAATAKGLYTQASDGSYQPSPGMSVVEIGPVVLKPAVIDPVTQAVTTPAVMDDRFHVDFQIDPNVIPESVYGPIAIEWTANGVADADVNNQEVCHVLSNVGLIDPATIVNHRHAFG